MKIEININNIGFIGLGVMGMSMFRNLSKRETLTLQGFYNDKSKLKILDNLNLLQASNIEDIFTTNDLIITCLPSSEEVRNIYFKKNMISLIKKNQIKK